jgi:hypothetical protein
LYFPVYDSRATNTQTVIITIGVTIFEHALAFNGRYKIFPSDFQEDMTIKLITDEKYSTRIYPTSLFD